MATKQMIDSTPVYHQRDALSDLEKHRVRAFEELGQRFIEEINKSGNSRELSLARTKVEEAVMWAVRHVSG